MSAMAGPVLEQVVRRAGGIAARVVDGEAVVITLSDGQVHFLNGTGTLLWQRVDGAHAVKDLIALLAERFEVDDEEASRDVLEFVRELEEKGIIELR
jgi:hypothetical protein